MSLNDFFGTLEPERFADGNSYLIGAFANVGAVETGDGLVLFDIGSEMAGERIFHDLRAITKAPIHTIVLSHGHFDHCFGHRPFLAEIAEKGWQAPDVIAHQLLPARFEKYNMLDRYHNWINGMQFSSVLFARRKNPVSTEHILVPTRLVREGESCEFQVGGRGFVVRAERGETDDAIWTWDPSTKTVFAGDLFISSFPNVGNPYKVQRYPKHWATALGHMLEKGPDFLVPGHGRLISGAGRVREALSVTARALDFVHDEVVKRLNEGMWFEDIYHEVLAAYPDEFKRSPWLQPIYGCPEYAVHASYRLYHGWYDSGNPTDVHPPRRADVSRELLDLLGDGGVERLLARAEALLAAGSIDVAMALVDHVLLGAMPGEGGQTTALERAILLKVKLVRKRSTAEPSMISRNIYQNYVNELNIRKKSIRK
ncbi:MAG: MBL fold metallo-hydrolase [Candidatus Lokiarchaeota archaeon]|nr:MBL fold metallo-hydrolase [Candidatus Lokiarchaeota archaeon]